LHNRLGLFDNRLHFWHEYINSFITGLQSNLASVDDAPQFLHTNASDTLDDLRKCSFLFLHALHALSFFPIPHPSL